MGILGGWLGRESESAYESVCVWVSACLNMCLSRFSKLSCIGRLRGRVHLRSFLAFLLTSLMTNEGFQPSFITASPRQVYTLSTSHCLSLFVYFCVCKCYPAVSLLLCLCSFVSVYVARCICPCSFLCFSFVPCVCLAAVCVFFLSQTYM